MYASAVNLVLVCIHMLLLSICVGIHICDITNVKLLHCNDNLKCRSKADIYYNVSAAVCVNNHGCEYKDRTEMLSIDTPIY